jgi:hypothetical protein
MIVQVAESAMQDSHDFNRVGRLLDADGGQAAQNSPSARDIADGYLKFGNSRNPHPDSRVNVHGDRFRQAPSGNIGSSDLRFIQTAY